MSVQFEHNEHKQVVSSLDKKDDKDNAENLSDFGLKIAIAQEKFMVGDVIANAKKMVEIANIAHEKGANMVIFPELALLGYPPEDLLLRPSLASRIQLAFDVLFTVKDIVMLVGYPHIDKYGTFNSLAIVYNGEIKGFYHKQCLPNYGVFDERRYFTRGHNQVLFDYQGLTIGLLICEDLWQEKPMQVLKQKGADLVVCINASPFEQNKQLKRKDLLKQQASKHKLPIIYVNSIGGQDDLVFDGGSMVVDCAGDVMHEATRFLPCMLYASIKKDDKGDIKISQQRKPPLALGQTAETYQALVVGLRDYVQHSGFNNVLVGLSGGLDSALTLCIAVDALGADKVYGVALPSQTTNPLLVQEAQNQAQRLNVSFIICPIHSAIDGIYHTLEPIFSHTVTDNTEINLESRTRGTMLMALSNKFGQLVLSSGNKTELAVGDITLYGDMAGGFDVLKDVYKTEVYELAEYRNRLEDTPVIPEYLLKKDTAPSHILDDYDTLDKILSLYIDEDYGFDAIIQAGYDKKIVKQVLTLVDRNEYKRRQAPIGTKISQKAFAKDRRYPLVNHWSLEMPTL